MQYTEVSLEFEHAFREAESREKSRKLARVSDVLASLWEIGQIILKLKPGHSLIISEDGSMYTGRVNVEKHTAIGKKYPGKSRHFTDAINRYENPLTKWWVNAPSPAFKNGWDLALRKSKEVEHPIFELFLEYFAEYIRKNPTMEGVRYNIVVDALRLSYHEIIIPGCPVICAVTKDGSMVYYKHGKNGEEIWAR